MNDPYGFVLLEETSGAFFAIDSEQRPVLLIPLAEVRNPADRTTSGISLEFHRSVAFRTAQADFASNAAILRCLNPSLAPTFRVLAADVARRVEPSVERPSPYQVSKVLSSWEELLRAIQRMSTEEEIGLWGELRIILMAEDADAALRAWHGPDKTPIDFAGGGIGIECKTTRTRLRHHFSMSQVGRPLGDLPSFFLSLWVGEDDVEGKTVSDLISEIAEEGVDPIMFERKLLRAGYSRTDADAYALRLVLLEDPTWFGQDDIPRVRAADPGVCNIRFTATLDPAMALELDAGNRLLATLVGLAESRC